MRLAALDRGRDERNLHEASVHLARFLVADGGGWYTLADMPSLAIAGTRVDRTSVSKRSATLHAAPRGCGILGYGILGLDSDERVVMSTSYAKS